MKVIIVSDSHGRDDKLQDILDKHTDADAFIHCGDIESDPSSFPQYVTVKGNNDMFFDYPDERVIRVGAHQFYIVHSHQFMFSRRVEQMVKKAKELQCDVVCYGHTHVAFYEVHQGVHVINPGSLWRSRDGRAPSYAIMTLQNETVDVEFVFLPQKKSKFFW